MLKAPVMKRPLLTLPPKAKPKTIVQENADFTSEGAPPPGKVGADVPVDTIKQAHIDHQNADEAEAAEQEEKARKRNA